MMTCVLFVFVFLCLCVSVWFHGETKKKSTAPSNGCGFMFQVILNCHWCINTTKGQNIIEYEKKETLYNGLWHVKICSNPYMVMLDMNPVN